MPDANPVMVGFLLKSNIYHPEPEFVEVCRECEREIGFSPGMAKQRQEIIEKHGNEIGYLCAPCAHDGIENLEDTVQVRVTQSQADELNARAGTMLTPTEWAAFIAEDFLYGESSKME